MRHDQKGYFGGILQENGQRRELFCLLASELRPSCTCVQEGGHFCEMEQLSSDEPGSRRWRGKQDLSTLLPADWLLAHLCTHYPGSLFTPT